MDMSEKKKDIVWLFPDEQTEARLPLQGIFIDCANEISKVSAVEFPVITVDNAGTKYKISAWKTDSSACVVKYGKDSDAWKGKLVQVSLRRGKFILVPVEEVLQ